MAQSSDMSFLILMVSVDDNIFFISFHSGGFDGSGEKKNGMKLSMIKSVVSNKALFFILVLLIMVALLVIFSYVQKSIALTSYVFRTEQAKSFECGFDQFDKKYLGFCVQYIKTAFLFLLVDLEIALLLPMFVNTPLYEKCYLLTLVLIVLTVSVLLLMLVVEVLMGGLSWQEEL